MKNRTVIPRMVTLILSMYFVLLNQSAVSQITPFSSVTTSSTADFELNPVILKMNLISNPFDFEASRDSAMIIATTSVNPPMTNSSILLRKQDLNTGAVIDGAKISFSGGYLRLFCSTSLLRKKSSWYYGMIGDMHLVPELIDSVYTELLLVGYFRNFTSSVDSLVMIWVDPIQLTVKQSQTVALPNLHNSQYGTSVISTGEEVSSFGENWSTGFLIAGWGFGLRNRGIGAVTDRVSFVAKLTNDGSLLGARYFTTNEPDINPELDFDHFGRVKKYYHGAHPLFALLGGANTMEYINGQPNYTNFGRSFIAAVDTNLNVQFHNIFGDQENAKGHLTVAIDVTQDPFHDDSLLILFNSTFSHAFGVTRINSFNGDLNQRSKIYFGTGYGFPGHEIYGYALGSRGSEISVFGLGFINQNGIEVGSAFYSFLDSDLEVVHSYMDETKAKNAHNFIFDYFSDRSTQYPNFFSTQVMQNNTAPHPTAVYPIDFLSINGTVFNGIKVIVADEVLIDAECDNALYQIAAYGDTLYPFSTGVYHYTAEGSYYVSSKAIGSQTFNFLDQVENCENIPVAQNVYEYSLPRAPKVQESILAFPNPARDYISFDKPGPIEFWIYDTFGQLRKHANVKTSKEISVNEMPKGIYRVVLLIDGTYLQSSFEKID